MDDELEIDVEDLDTDEIQALLGAEGQPVSLEQAQMIANFVKEVGGLEEALSVIAELRRDRNAA